MKKWELFEVSCTDYLNGKFGKYANFICEGGSNSRISDILVKTKSGKLFYIDAKYTPSQCGQFVLFPNIKYKRFEYSKQNVNNINIYSNEIVEYMNSEFDEFSNAGTRGKAILINNSSEIFWKWIVLMYKQKGVDFFITNNYKIIPINNLNESFNITAKYRIKKSGSSEVGKKYISDILQYIRNNYPITEYKIIEDRKLFVKSIAELDKLIFVLGDYKYMFSKRNDIYEIRKLSNTQNSNVIFSISEKKNINGISDEEFIYYLS